MEIAPRLALWPGLCLTIVVYCVNKFGDALRDLLDPPPQGRRRWPGLPWREFGQENHQGRGILIRQDEGAPSAH